MSKSMRWSEKWFRRGLWLVAFLFAWFLVGLGGTIVGDLPQVEQRQTLDDFLDPQRAPALKQSIEAAQLAGRDAQDALDQARLRQQTAQANNRAARETFGNWLATRLLRLFYGVRYTDLGPFRAIRYDALLALRMADRNYGWTVEMQVKAAKLGLRSTEVPVDYRVRIGESKVSGTVKGTIGAGYKILLTIFRHI